MQTDEHSERVLDAWQQHVSEIPSTFGRFVFPGLKNRDSGKYTHYLIKEVFDEEGTDRVIRRTHLQVFAEWLTYTLAQQQADLNIFLSGVDGHRRQILAACAVLAPHVWCIPDGASMSGGFIWRTSPRSSNRSTSSTGSCRPRARIRLALAASARRSGDLTGTNSPRRRAALQLRAQFALDFAGNAQGELIHLRKLRTFHHHSSQRFGTREAQTSTRPASPTASSAARISRVTAGSSESGRRDATRTLTSRCG